MKLYKNLLILLLLGLCCSCRCEILRAQDGKTVPYAGNYSSKKIYLPQYRKKAGEFRGIWVATVKNIDFPLCKSASDFKKAYSQVLNNAKKAGFNAVIFQVRPNADAFYRSNLNPWSQYLSGSCGKGIADFDPLSYMVSETHKHGMEFHAWLNPFRVCGNTKLSKSQYLKTLPENHFARRNPHLVLYHPSEQKGLYSLQLDPGAPEVRSHIFQTVGELVQNYRIDAIHFDDYFYPYSDIGNTDASTFKKHNSSNMTLENWRRNNVNLVIQGIHQRLKEYNTVKKTNIQFGISPFGIWGNRKNLPAGSLTGGKESYVTNFADTRLWVKQGWIDYIAPQLYWSFGHKTASYAALCDWWCLQTKNTKVKLYIGIAPYQLGSNSTWGKYELANQLRYNSARKVSGSIWFSYSKVFAPLNPTMKQGVDNALRLWKK